MVIIGCDFHPRFQQIAYIDQESGEYGERRLNHPEEAAQFDRSLAGKPVRIGLEATGNHRWFRSLLPRLVIRCCWAIRAQFMPRFPAGNRPISETRDRF